MTVNVLGVPYTVKVCSAKDEPRMTDCDGFCDETSKEIFAEKYQEYANDQRSKLNLILQTEKVIRHEIVHAFLFESGLAENSPWAQNEELVDWIAIQAPKLFIAFNDAGVL